MRTTIAAVAVAALLAGCGDAGIPDDADLNRIEGDPLPNQGYPDMEEPDLGSTLAQEVPNPQPEECEHEAFAAAEGAATLLDVAERAGDFRVFLGLVESSDLADRLVHDGPFTVLAPTDAAFAALPPGMLDILRDNPEDRDSLLRNHVVPGACSIAQLQAAEQVPSLAERSIDVSMSQDTVIVDYAHVVQPDLEADNGILHGIDSVLLLPPVPAATEDASGQADG
jgi:uncharacterized surface protein with fasciclin (FAS1) repeats